MRESHEDLSGKIDCIRIYERTHEYENQPKPSDDKHDQRSNAVRSCTNKTTRGTITNLTIDQGVMEAEPKVL